MYIVWEQFLSLEKKLQNRGRQTWIIPHKDIKKILILKIPQP